jgi:hypothetical protein
MSLQDAKYGWIIGVLLAALASVIRYCEQAIRHRITLSVRSNLGLNLQKLAHKTVALDPEHQRVAYFKHRFWCRDRAARRTWVTVRRAQGNRPRADYRRLPGGLRRVGLR